MIKRLLFVLVLGVLAYGQGFISIPPFELSESLAEARSHGIPLQYWITQPGNKVVYGYKGDGMRYTLTFYRGSLIEVECSMYAGDDLLGLYTSFVQEGGKSLGFEGTETVVTGQYPGHTTKWRSTNIDYEVRHTHSHIELTVKAHEDLYK